jgi:hypothetical protein
MGEMYNLSKAQLDGMRAQSDYHLAARPELRGPYAVPPRPVKAPVVPAEFVSPAKGRPVDKAVAFLLHELATGPAKVNALMASAAKMGSPKALFAERRNG